MCTLWLTGRSQFAEGMASLYVAMKTWSFHARSSVCENSRAGTTVTRPGQQPVRLRAGEPLEIEPGTVVSLADEVVLRYEVPG